MEDHPGNAAGSAEYVKRCFSLNNPSSHHMLRLKLRDYLKEMSKSSKTVNWQSLPPLVIDPIAKQPKAPVTKLSQTAKRSPSEIEQVKPAERAMSPEREFKKPRPGKRERIESGMREHKADISKSPEPASAIPFGSSFNSLLRQARQNASLLDPSNEKEPASTGFGGDDFISLDSPSDQGSLKWGTDVKLKPNKKQRKKTGEGEVAALESVVDTRVNQPCPAADATKLNERQKRFENTKPSMYVDEHSLEPVVGYCETVEKSYLRLTGPPNPAVVRPRKVLKKAMMMVRAKWEADRNYSYCLDQLKSIRQDMAVQGIRDNLTIAAYELNANIALEVRDLGEFNQCQMQLKELYQQGSHFNNDLRDGFIASHIFYLLYQGMTQNINETLVDVQNKEFAGSAKVTQAIQVVQAAFAQDLPRLFILYSLAEDKTKLAMNMFMPKYRTRALADILSAIKPRTCISMIAAALAFDDIDEARAFVEPFVNVSEDGTIESSSANFARIQKVLESFDRKQ